MFNTVLSAAVFGVEGRLVSVEADVGDGLPSFAMVGFLSAQVKEAQERVRTALKNAGFRMEPKRVTVNLSPADMRKCGTGFDFPIAVAVAAAYGRIPQENLEGILIAGELSLNGEVLPIPGILPMAARAAKEGCRACLVPKANEAEAAMIDDVQVFGVRDLREAIAWLCEETQIEPAKKNRLCVKPQAVYEDFASVSGQEAAKRAVEVAASGAHNLLMVGPPGAGKSMLAKCIPGILPLPSVAESLEISKIYSVAGLIRQEGKALCGRPYRAPHHTITAKAMAGGGTVPRPGEISLAHNGVLFLDELPEFSRDALEVLRQPLEDRRVCISRNGAAYEFPAHFMLVAAMNPCPCGYFPDMSRCTCTHYMVRRYLERVSAPLLERMDISVEVEGVEYADLAGQARAESSAEIRARVEKTRAIQEERYCGTKYRTNADLDQEGIRAYCQLGDAENRLLEAAYDRLDLSARSYFRVIKVARTIADMEQSGRIRGEHLQEALCYRNINKKYWMGR